MCGHRVKGITEKTISKANEGRRKRLCEIGKSRFPQEERTSFIKAEEKGPVERSHETPTRTGYGIDSSSKERKN